METEEEVEVIDVVEEFLGDRYKVVYQIMLCMLTYTGLLAYTQVFVQSFLSQVWPSVPMVFPTALFAAVVIPLSCLDLSEQIQTQVVMSVLRFLSLGLMLAGMFVAIFVDDVEPRVRDGGDGGLALVNMEGFGLILTTAVFSQLFQHSVPGLIRPLTEDKRRHVPSMFGAALLTTCSIYIFLGIVSSFHLGDAVQQSINLNFVGYTWGTKEGDVFYEISLTLSMLVVLFPAFDTLSIFPLISNTLGNNLRAFFPTPNMVDVLGMRVARCVGLRGGEGGLGEDIARVEGRDGGEDTVGEREENMKRVSTILWRIIASLPPIVLSMVVTDLVITMQIAGVCGIVVAFVFPSLLQMEALERLKQIPVVLHESDYQISISRAPWAPHTVLMFSAIALGVCVYQFVVSFL
jgi:hypothetical protein